MAKQANIQAASRYHGFTSLLVGVFGEMPIAYLAFPQRVILLDDIMERAKRNNVSVEDAAAALHAEIGEDGLAKHIATLTEAFIRSEVGTGSKTPY